MLSLFLMVNGHAKQGILNELELLGHSILGNPEHLCDIGPIIPWRLFLFMGRFLTLDHCRGRVMELNLMLVDELAFKLADHIARVDNLHERSELLLDLLLLVNECLFLSCQRLEDLGEGFQYERLLLLVSLNEFVLLVERVQDEVLKVIVVLLEGLGESLVLDH
jgi:hypothetical protein